MAAVRCSGVGGALGSAGRGGSRHGGMIDAVFWPSSGTDRRCLALALTTGAAGPANAKAQPAVLQ